MEMYRHVFAKKVSHMEACIDNKTLTTYATDHTLSIMIHHCPGIRLGYLIISPMRPRSLKAESREKFHVSWDRLPPTAHGHANSSRLFI